MTSAGLCGAEEPGKRKTWVRATSPGASRPEPRDSLRPSKRVPIEDVDRHDVGSGCGKPAASGRAWDPVLEGASDILCGSDEIAKAMVVAGL